jgi:hypothetical protein
VLNPGDPDTLRALILLLSALIGLATVILNLTHHRLKEAETPEAKAAIYRGALDWLGTALWLGAIPIPFIIMRGGAEITLFLWIPAFALESYVFLTNTTQRTLRRDVFRLVFSSLALGIMIVFAAIQNMMYVLDRIMGLIDGMAKALSN